MVRSKMDRLVREVTGLLILHKLPVCDSPQEELSLRVHKGTTKLGLDTVSTRKIVDMQERLELMERAKTALREEGFVVTNATPEGARCWIQVDEGDEQA